MQGWEYEVGTDPVRKSSWRIAGSDRKQNPFVIGSPMDYSYAGAKCLRWRCPGVTGAWKFTARLKDEGTLPSAIHWEIWGFNMEESSILGGTFGSGCVTRDARSGYSRICGKISKVWLQSGKTESTKERYQQSMSATLEYHIEQGDKLRSYGIRDVGVVQRNRQHHRL